MTTASNVGGGDSLQLGGAKRRHLDGPKQPRGAMVLMHGKPPLSTGASYGEHPDARRARLRRITGR